MGLQQFERRLERLVEGVFAKAFRSGLQPVELARRLTREIELQRAVGVRGVIAPNRFRFELAQDDYERFEGFADVLAKELRTEAREHAKNEGYLFLGPVEVTLEADPGLTKGVFNLVAEVAESGEGPVGRLVLGDGREVEVGSAPVVIGRMADCDVCLEDDARVSRRHAEVRREGDAFVVEDLGSMNGTQVDGVGVKAKRLQGGEQIRVGSTSLRFET